MTRSTLTAAQVEYIRTSGLTDAYLARKLRRARKSVWAARVGLSHKDHPTPPDTRERSGGGRKARPEAIVQTDSGGGP